MKNYIRHTLLLVFAGVNFLHSQTTILDQTLLTQASFNSFTAVSVNGAQTWTFSSSYGAVCTGYSAGVTYENEDWLISPTMNLVDMNNVKLTFSHTRGTANVLNVGVAQGYYKVFATSNYTGNPTTTQWTELTGVNHTVPTAWQYVSSGELIIPEAAKSANSRIAFRYFSNSSAAATWEIKNVKVTGEVPVNPNMATFKITNWNTEWLGCTSFGPTDETLQLNNVASAMLAMNSDIFCLQEVTNTVTENTFTNLVTLLGNDVWEGKLVPATTGDCEQRQGIIYKKARVQFVNSSLLSTGNAAQGNSYYYNWSSGRFPAVYHLNLIAGVNTVPFSIVNIHAKSEDGDAASYTRRLGGSQGLKTILDGSSYNTKRFVLIGDFNDYLIGTTSNTCNCTVSPYQNFMNDTTNYTGTTQYLNGYHWNHELIENIMFSNELSTNYVSNSAAQEVTAIQGITNYFNTTSDHVPVSATFQFSTLSNPEFAMANGLKIFPNPVQNELKLEGTEFENDTTIAVYDITGRQMLSAKMNANAVNVSTLPSGVYILKAGNRFGRFVKK